MPSTLRNKPMIQDCYPKERDEQCSMVSGWVKNILTLCVTTAVLMLINAGTGSGKTRCMFHITDISNYEIIFISSPNNGLQEQLYEAFQQYNFAKCTTCSYLLQDITTNTIEYNIHHKIKTIVFVSSIRSNGLEYTINTQKFINILKAFSDIPKISIIDELDLQLTSLTGSAQPRTDRNPTNIKEFSRFYDKNKNSSLNIFDVFREYGIPVIGLSATLNNLISTKQALLGYNPSEISILNIYPIKELYKQQIKHVDTSNFDELVPYLKKAEETDITSKILLLFSCDRDINVFKQYYHREFRKSIDSIDITFKKKLSHDQLKKGISKSKYIIGIDMINTGFDVSTLVENTRFILGIIFRDFNDKSSQPLSKNPDNPLSNETSATLLQAVARVRNEGLILLDKKSHSGFKSLYEEHVKIFNIINEGYNQVFRYGYKIDTQMDRYMHTLFISIIQNINEGSNSENRDVIKKLIKDINNITHRDIQEDLLDINIVKHNYNIYTDAIKRIWYEAANISLTASENDEDETDDEDTVHHNSNGVDTEDENEYKEEDVSDITDSESISSPTINSSTNTLPTIHSSGNGYREGRMIDENIKEPVIHRSKCICIWCGEKISTDDGEEAQIAHMKRNDRGGEYSLDNLGYAHRACDGIIDGGYIIPDPENGGIWYHPRYNTFNVDSNQLQYMSYDNKLDRWNWAKEHKKRPTLTNIEFRKYLTEQKYVLKF